MKSPDAIRTYVMSKDGQRAIVADICDSLHALIWGRLMSGNVPFPGAVEMTAEEAREWIIRERQVEYRPNALPVTSPYHPDYDRRLMDETHKGAA